MNKALFDIDQAAAGDLVNDPAPAGHIGGRQSETPRCEATDAKTAFQDRLGRTQSAGSDAGHPAQLPRPTPAAGGASMTETHCASASGDLTRAWPCRDRPAIDFVLLAGDQLPATPFHLRPGEFVSTPAIFLRRLLEDVAAGPLGPCAQSALRDCRTLQGLFGRRRGRIISTEISARRRVPKPR